MHIKEIRRELIKPFQEQIKTLDSATFFLSTAEAAIEPSANPRYVLDGACDVSSRLLQ
jgi:hypothetical protein